MRLVLALAGSDCERWHAGWLAQPANTVSSLAFMVVGACLLLRSRRVSAGRGGLLTGGIALIGVGVGSAAYHGPQPGWAHLAHDGSALALAALVVGRTTWRVVVPDSRRSALTAWRSVLPWAALALAAYLAGRSGSPLCNPASIWQPHAAWHLLCAITVGTAWWRGEQVHFNGRPPAALHTRISRRPPRRDCEETRRGAGRG